MLEDFGAVGVSWQQRGSEALADFALGDDAVERLRDFAARAGLAELAYLETCNRVEVVFRRQAGSGEPSDVRPLAFELLAGRAPAPGEAERELKAWRGEGACEHLFLVAAGLDSAAVGETDVAGQVRACQSEAAAAGLSGPGLATLFEEALRIAAAVHSGTRLGAGSISLAEVAMGHVRAQLRRTPGMVALVGVSAMTKRAALALADDGAPFVVVNRSPEKARELADGFAADAMALDAFRDDPPPVQAVLVSTGANVPLLGKAELAKLRAAAPLGEPPLCVDMAVPANIDRNACAELGVPRIGMDAIVAEAERNRGTRAKEVGEARALVDDALPRLRQRFAERLHGPLFAALRQHYEDAAASSIRRFEKNLRRTLSPAERQAADDWARALARRLAHLPVAGLKSLLRDGPEGALDAFLAGVPDLRLNGECAADSREHSRRAERKRG